MPPRHAAEVNTNARQGTIAVAPLPMLSPPKRLAHSRRLRLGLYATLTAGTLLVHGYHPFAEDGGLYAAGVEYLLDRSLFPHYSAFVVEHLRFSLFAPALYLLLHLTHLSLQTGLLLVYLLSTFFTFWAADLVLQRAVAGSARVGGLLLLFAWWTLPVAGTSLFVADPYLTARSLSSPLCLLALSIALGLPQGPDQGQGWKRPRALTPRKAFACVLSLCAAALLHPLMCGYALGLLLCLMAVRSRRWMRWSTLLCAAALALGGLLQYFAGVESPAMIAADLSRYYWFPARWQWFELLGLAGPLLVLFALERRDGPDLRAAGRSLCRACLLLGTMAILVTVTFAHTGSSVQAVARLQPLRSFAMIYVLMVLLLGARASSWWMDLKRRCAWPAFATAVPFVFVAVLACAMFSVQRIAFAHSDHLELPSRVDRSPNPWVQAFTWIRVNTPKDALFALDANYITRADSDAQSFRAIAERSALPDYSKDGGEAAITRSLAAAWYAAKQAQTGLDSLDDSGRAARLRPYAVNWIILAASTKTQQSCPYENAVVKVCRLGNNESGLGGVARVFAK